MSDNVVRELQTLLDADAHEVVFLDYMPAPTVEKLHQAVAKTIDDEAQALTQAIAKGTAALPGPLAWLAGRILAQTP